MQSSRLRSALLRLLLTASVMFLSTSSQTDAPLLLRHQSATFEQVSGLVPAGVGRVPVSSVRLFSLLSFSFRISKQFLHVTNSLFSALDTECTPQRAFINWCTPRGVRLGLCVTCSAFPSIFERLSGF